MDGNNYVGNISTVVKYVSMLIAGYFISLLASYGFNLNVDQTLLSEIIGSIIFLILAHIDATHPNTLKILGNQNLTTKEDITADIPEDTTEADQDEGA